MIYWIYMIVDNKWIFKKKFEVDDTMEKYKACLVERGYSHVKGIYFSEVFSHIVKMALIRFLLAIITIYDLEVDQMDVKTIFLHGDLEEEIYIL